LGVVTNGKSAKIGNRNIRIRGKAGEGKCFNKKKIQTRGVSRRSLRKEQTGVKERIIRKKRTDPQ